MTRTQVRYLLGTPMVPDLFDKDRWDYLYYFQPAGASARPTSARLIVLLQGRQGRQVRHAEQRASARRRPPTRAPTDRQVPKI